MNTSAPIIIIGAGLGGMAAAIRLAAQGREVTLLEKNERVGGKLNLLHAAGYTFDTGPSLLTMPWVLEELFASAGRQLSDYLTLVPVEPTCRYTWPDGTTFNAWQHLPQLVQELERLSPDDLPGFFQFLAYSARIYNAVADNFLLRPFDGISELITPRLLRDGPRIDALRSVDRAVRAYFRSPYLRQLFNRYATYNGSSPYRSPATFNVIAYIELTTGGWYVQGGMYQLAQAMQRLAEELGVQVRINSPVGQILTRNGSVQGVRLASGEELPASQVIVNADPRYAYAALLPEAQNTAARLARLEPSCSGFMLFLGVNRNYPQLAHHNIFFSHDYPSEFAAIFNTHVPAADPTIYIAATSLSDPSHAPAGHMNLFILVNTPALHRRINWPREADAYGDMIIQRLEQAGLTHLSQHLSYRETWTPQTIAERYNAADGAIYGLASNNRFAAFLRPPLRAREQRGLYFVGGGTHPGGGIPLVLLSGRAVAERVWEGSRE
ncbi:phytoene desaturase family protein [Candidatus Viridilinea mediisalina]|uniref:4,4'-diaponeurosporene oxygenase n=1 Tax=Candidatus Viridilinea mediisalina TaxID=2024553 RepID=A0A2A6RFY1_9CHLR|nr:phytoene desaturase family protein [Candidatus Viridilinea mediisalina]PDW01796.1 phytoene dehydrogenase [Candidatus Viridilinea mediisalina]